MESITVEWLRHAESEANVGLKTPSPETAALTAHGKAEAERFAASITHGPEVVVVSSFLRAKETAEPILSRFPGARLVSLPLHEFTYLSLDRCQSTSFEDRRAMVRDFWQRADPNYVDGTGAESFHQFRERMRSCLPIIARFRCRKVLVISHALVMQMLRAAAAAGSFDAVYMVNFRNLMLSHTIANLEVISTCLDENFIHVGSSYGPESEELLSASYRTDGDVSENLEIQPN
jgi:broad specificity phosphatase PhoE